MVPSLPLMTRIRQWLAGLLFTLAGKLDPSYDVWLDTATPRRYVYREKGD